MRGGKNKKRPLGYTIVEVMVFLAISGVMFVMAATFVSGRQTKTEFRQGMNEAASEIQSVINDVNNGSYPSSDNFSCTADSLGSQPTFNSPPSSEQGTNQGCIFLGKVIQFGVQGSNGNGYNVYTVAGRQYTGSTDGPLVSNFAQAKPIAVHSPIDLTDKKNLEWGLQVTAMKSSLTNIGAIGFFGSLAKYSGGSLQSGSQTANIVKIPSALNTSEGTMVTKIKQGVRDVNILTSPNVVVCFQGGNNQRGSIAIGGSSAPGQKLTIDMELGNNIDGRC